MKHHALLRQLATVSAPWLFRSCISSRPPRPKWSCSRHRRRSHKNLGCHGYPVLFLPRSPLLDGAPAVFPSAHISLSANWAHFQLKITELSGAPQLVMLVDACDRRNCSVWPVGTIKLSSDGTSLVAQAHGMIKMSIYIHLQLHHPSSVFNFGVLI